MKTAGETRNRFPTLDLYTSLYKPAQLPARFEFGERFATRDLFDTVDRFQNVVKGVADLACHQNTRIADFSMSARSMGCNPSRVGTVTVIIDEEIEVASRVSLVARN